MQKELCQSLVSQKAKKDAMSQTERLRHPNKREEEEVASFVIRL